VSCIIQSTIFPHSEGHVRSFDTSPSSSCSKIETLGQSDKSISSSITEIPITHNLLSQTALPIKGNSLQTVQLKMLHLKELYNVSQEKNASNDN
jgi:hypothetical protein